MTNNLELSGIGAVVTGASRGLGLALAEELARRGARVAMVARDAAVLGAQVARLRAAGIADVHAIAADVGDKAAVAKIAGIAGGLIGEIDVVVHAASTLGPVPLRLVLDTECEDLAAVLETNLVGPFRITKAFAGAMVVRGRGGLIVHVSSDAAVEAYPRWGAYGVSKAAQDHLSRILGAELAETGVKVIAVDPGEMDTAMHAAAIPDADRAALARPADVARVLADMVAARDRLVPGARLVASAWAAADETVAATGEKAVRA